MKNWAIGIVCAFFLGVIVYVLKKCEDRGGYGAGVMVGNIIVAAIVMACVLLCTLICIIIEYFF